MPLIVGFPSFATKPAPDSADLNAALGKLLEKLGGVLGTTRYPGALARDNFAGGLKLPRTMFRESASLVVIQPAEGSGQPCEVPVQAQIAAGRDVRVFAITGQSVLGAEALGHFSLRVGDNVLTFPYPDLLRRASAKTSGNLALSGPAAYATLISYPVDFIIPAGAGLLSALGADTSWLRNVRLWGVVDHSRG